MEVADYYQYHSEVLRRPESVRAQAIFIKRFVYDEKSGRQTERTTARRRAEDLRARLAAGADFEDLARRYSEDAKSAAQGGLLGEEKSSFLVERGGFEAGLDQALFGGKPGEISAVIEGPANYYVVKVLRHLPEGVPPLEEIDNEVFMRCFRDRVRTAEERLFREAYSKVLVLDSKGRRVTLDQIWPSAKPEPRRSLLSPEEG